MNLPLDNWIFALAMTLIAFGLILSSYTFDMGVMCSCAPGVICDCPDPYVVQKGMSLFPIVAGGGNNAGARLETVLETKAEDGIN